MLASLSLNDTELTDLSILPKMGGGGAAGVGGKSGTANIDGIGSMPLMYPPRSQIKVSGGNYTQT